MTTNISQLPDDLLLLIFQYLSVQQLCLGVRRTCKKWNELSYDFSLWTILNLQKYGTSLTDKDVVDILMNVGQHVKELNLRGCKKISNLIFESEKHHCPLLEQIDIIGTSTSHEGILELMTNTEKFPKLSGVICEYREWQPENNFYQSCCDAYQVGRKLKHLYDPYSNQLVSSVVSVSGIQDGLIQIAALYNSLETLTVSQNGIEAIALEALCKNNPGLCTINIPDCLWAVDTLDTAVGYLTSLKHLNISNTPTLDVALVKVAEKCPQLEHLNVTGCRKITDVGLCQVSQIWTNLKHLVLNESKGTSGNVTDNGLRSFAENCSKLNHVKVCFCPSVSDAGIEALALGCPLLETIDLTGCLALTDKSVFAFANHSERLKKLTASECVQFTSESINQLVTNCPMLHTLELETCHYLTKLNFGSEHVENGLSSDVLCDSIDNHVQEAESQMMLTPNIRCLILDCLQSSPYRIRVLDLGFCSKIATDSVKQIAKHCIMLQNLSLRGCYLVTDAGIEAIAVKCLLLQVLDLCASTTHHSKFTDQALQALADNAKNLVMLNVQRNMSVSIEGVKEVVSKCDTLSRLGVSGKAMSMVDAVQFCTKTRGRCSVDGMNVAYLGPNSKSEYLVRLPARRLPIM